MATTPPTIKVGVETNGYSILAGGVTALEQMSANLTRAMKESGVELVPVAEIVDALDQTAQGYRDAMADLVAKGLVNASPDEQQAALTVSGYTRHGHPIAGLPQVGRPTMRGRCGGPRMCKTCQEDAARARADAASTL